MIQTPLQTDTTGIYLTTPFRPTVPWADRQEQPAGKQSLCGVQNTCFVFESLLEPWKQLDGTLSSKMY